MLSSQAKHIKHEVLQSSEIWTIHTVQWQRIIKYNSIASGFRWLKETAPFICRLHIPITDSISKGTSSEEGAEGEGGAGYRSKIL